MARVYVSLVQFYAQDFVLEPGPVPALIKLNRFKARLQDNENAATFLRFC